MVTPSTTARRRDGVKPVVAQHMRDKASLEYFRNAMSRMLRQRCRRRRPASPTRSPSAAKQRPLHERPRVARAPSMQMPGDFAWSRRSVRGETPEPDGDFAGHRAAEIVRQRRIVVAPRSRSSAPHLQRRDSVAIGHGQPAMGVAIVESCRPARSTVRGSWRAITAPSRPQRRRRS